MEALCSTGLIIELSPDARWGAGVRTLAVGGLLQMAAAITLATGRKTRWALSVLVCYVGLDIAISGLPLVLGRDAIASAIGTQFNSLALIGGLLYWFHCERNSVIGVSHANHSTRSGLRSIRPAPD
jgi:hypothetical protein